MSRLAFVVPSFPSLSETFIVRKFTGLLSRGWDVHVVCTSAIGRWDRFPELNRPDVRARVHAPSRTRPRWIAAARLPSTLLTSAHRSAFWKYLHEGYSHFGHDVLRRSYLDNPLVDLQPDLIHFEFGALAHERMHVGRLLGAKIVVSLRGYDANYVGLDDPDYYTDVWKEVDALHVLSDALWQTARARGCPPNTPVKRIPPAIDPKLFDPADKAAMNGQEQPFTVLSVGRLDWVKGYEYALEAVRRLVDAGVECRYVIVGDGPYAESLKFIGHQLDLEEVVRFEGAVPSDKVRGYMQRADVLLHASVSEGFCNAVLEAQAMQLPVVASDAGGLPENVEHGRTGFVVPRRNPDRLAESLIHLAGNPRLRADMGRAGRERVLRHFRMDEQLSRFEKLYRNVLEGSVQTKEPAAVS